MHAYYSRPALWFKLLEAIFITLSAAFALSRLVNI